MSNFLVLLGPPGAGKGTQAKRLAQKLDLPHISSGDIFRENLAKETELGQDARRYMDRGELVPDDVTIAMIEQRLAQPDCAEGVLLDGFPRTIPQANGLREIMKKQGKSLKAVLCIDVDQEELIRRLSGRLVCRENGHIYHRDYNPPQQSGFCDVDGSELYQRDDDKEETVRHRIEVYQEQTAPLVDHYRAANLLIEVDGNQSVTQVTEALLDAVQQEA